MSEFNFRISGERSVSSIKSIDIIDTSYLEPSSSPIQQFNESKVEYLKLLGSYSRDQVTEQYLSLAEQLNSEWYKLSNLTVLGLISSVERYVRSIIRRLILIDNSSLKNSYNSQVSFGAALHHHKDMLPEAFLEIESFTSGYNIKDTIKKCLGINLNKYNQDSKFKTALEDFNLACQLRHCIVHRSGFLGSNNAMELSYDDISSVLEKPIRLTLPQAQEVFTACDNLVKEINDKLFHEVLKRTVESISWSGDLRSDRTQFNKYYYLFVPEDIDCDTFRRQCYSDFSLAYSLHNRQRQRR